jgi:hypothetical protein
MVLKCNITLRRPHATRLRDVAFKHGRKPYKSFFETMADALGGKSLSQLVQGGPRPAGRCEGLRHLLKQFCLFDNPLTRRFGGTHP